MPPLGGVGRGRTTTAGPSLGLLFVSFALLFLFGVTFLHAALALGLGLACASPRFRTIDFDQVRFDRGAHDLLDQVFQLVGLNEAAGYQKTSWRQTYSDHHEAARDLCESGGWRSYC